jgi:hypothetical protein
MRLKFDQSRPTAGLLSRNQRRTRAAKGIYDDTASVRRVPDGVGDQRDRLRRRMQLELAPGRPIEDVLPG